MIRFVLAFAMVALIGSVDGAEASKQPAETPKALLIDQEDDTDIYEIPLGTSVIEEEQQQRKMQRAIDRYNERQAARQKQAETKQE